MRMEFEDVKSETVATRFRKQIAPFADFMAYCILIRSTRHILVRRRKRAGVFVIRVPPNWHSRVLKVASMMLERPERNKWVSSRDDTLAVSLDAFGKRRGFDEREFVQSVSGHRFSLVVGTTEQVVPEIVELSADEIVDLQAPTDRHVRAACTLFFGVSPSQNDIHVLRSCRPDELALLMRPGRKFSLCLTRARSVVVERATSSVNIKGPTLSELFGYGDAFAWGKQLAADLRHWSRGDLDWEDVDKGLLLSGPPGTGKTMFARALANECEAHLEIASLARWQSNGHLGDLLKAMRSSFEAARTNAPSILFVDELDSIGDRAAFSGQNAQYCTEVVNAFLECLDGLERRDGVVVIAASNHYRRIDPAILRSGRLDHHIIVGLPHINDRCKILAQHLENRIDPMQLEAIGKVTEGWSGADLEKLARQARRVSRLDKVEITPELIIGCLPPRRQLSAPHRFRVALHEAGHAIVGSMISGRVVEEITLETSVAPTALQMDLGITKFQTGRDDNSVLTARDMLNAIATYLAGSAAEDITFGERATGSGGDHGSDLAIATRMAWDFHALYGFGKRFTYHGRGEPQALGLQPPADIGEMVERTLQSQYHLAVDCLRLHRSLLVLVAERLSSQSTIGAAEFLDLVCSASTTTSVQG